MVKSCLTTFNLPQFTDLTFQVPTQYCSLQHWTLLLSLVTSTTGCCFLLWQQQEHPFILSGVISPLISSSILGTYWPEEVLFQYPINFAFSYCSWGSQGKNSEVVCRSLLQWTTFCQNSPPWPVCLEALHGMAHSFIQLDKAVIQMISLTSFLWLWLAYCLPSDG